MRRLWAGRPSLTRVIQAGSNEMTAITRVLHGFTRSDPELGRFYPRRALPTPQRWPHQEMKRHQGGHRVSRKSEKQSTISLPENERLPGLDCDLPHLQPSA